MRETDRIRIDAMSDILAEAGIVATSEQIKKITLDFSYHMDLEREMDSYSRIGGIKEEICSMCKAKEGQLKLLQMENEVFRNSVKKRRGAERVWIEGDSVMYE